MSVIYINSSKDLDKIVPNTNLVLGLFDGVHIGHYQLISASRYMSKGLLSLITFDRSLKSNDQEILLSLKDKIDVFTKIGVDNIYIFKCSNEFKEMSYRKFMSDVLERFKPNKIFCGPDFKFGYRAQGDIYSLKSYFNNVIVLNYVNNYDGTKISSSIIKKYIRNGNIEDANRFLGYNYYVKGIVIKGKQIGHELGYPTINLKLTDNYVMPSDGVYISKVIFNNKAYPSMTNVGDNPTICDSKKVSIETYILNFDEDLYNEEVSIVFYKRLRDEIKFNNLDELKEELSKNKDEVAKYFEIYWHYYFKIIR